MIPNMPRQALNPAGGNAAVLQACLPAEDVALIDELAAERGVSRSAMAREIIVQGLREAKEEGQATA